MCLKNNNDKLILGKVLSQGYIRLLVCSCLFSPFISDFNLVVAVCDHITCHFCNFVKLLYKIDDRKKNVHSCLVIENLQTFNSEEMLTSFVARFSKYIDHLV